MHKKGIFAGAGLLALAAGLAGLPVANASSPTTPPVLECAQRSAAAAPTTSGEPAATSTKAPTAEATTAAPTTPSCTPAERQRAAAAQVKLRPKGAPQTGDGSEATN